MRVFVRPVRPTRPRSRPARECRAYGQRCAAGTDALKAAHRARRRAGATPTPARVSAWLASVTYAPGKPARAGAPGDAFRNRHTDPMARRLLLGDAAPFDFVGRLEHLGGDWASLNRSLVARGVAPLGPLAPSGRHPDRTAARANATFALLEPPIPPSATAADVRHLCRVLAPDLACLAGVYEAPTLCRRAPTPADRAPPARAAGKAGLWDLWIKNRAPPA